MPPITRSMAKKMGKTPNAPPANSRPKTAKKTKKSVKRNTVPGNTMRLPRKRTDWDDYVEKTREFLPKISQDGHHYVNVFQVAKELKRLEVGYATMTLKDVEKALNNLWGKNASKYLNRTRITAISGQSHSPTSPPKKSIFAKIKNKFTMKNKYKYTKLE